MKRATLVRIVVALAVVLVAVTATIAVVSAMQANGLIASLNGRNATSNDSGGAGLRITVLPAPADGPGEETPIPDPKAEGPPVNLGSPAIEHIISNTLSLSAYVPPPPYAVTALTPGLDIDAAAGLMASIVQVQDADGNPVAVDIKSYAATLSYNGTLMNVLGVRHDALFPGSESIDNMAGATDFDGTASAGVATPCQLSFLTLRLIGSALQPATATLTFSDIRDPDGNGISPLTPVLENTFLRGDAKADGQVKIGDALFICQYLVGLRDIGEGLDKVEPVNAASVKHDDGFDKIGIGDALYIAQYKVGLRDANFNFTVD